MPKLTDWTEAPARVPAPPRLIKLLGTPNIIIGVDIETHDWSTNGGCPGTRGQFGSNTRCDSDTHNARIVQIAWTLMRENSEPIVKVRLVRPEAFVVSAKATTYHGIAMTKRSSVVII